MLGAGLIDVHAHFTTEMYIVAARAAGHVRADGMPEQFVTRGCWFPESEHPDDPRVR